MANAERFIRTTDYPPVDRPPLADRGGYIPGLDHGVPPDVPRDHYCYWLRLMKEIYGIG